MSRRLLLIALALLCASLGLSACGNKQETVTRGESEAIYVTLGDVQYQVQLSRQIDPYSPGDRDLLKGVAPIDAILPTILSIVLGAAFGYASEAAAGMLTKKA